MKCYRIRSALLNPYLLVLPIILVLLITNYREVKSQPAIICAGVCDLAWSPNEELLAAVNQLGLWLYQAEETDALPSLIPFENTTSVDFSPDGEFIAVSHCQSASEDGTECDGTLSIFNLKDQRWQDIMTYDYPIGHIQFSPDGTSIAFVERNPSQPGLRIIDLSSKESVAITDPIRTNLIKAFTFTSDGNYVAVSNGEYTFMPESFHGATVWSRETGSLIASTSEPIFIEDLITIEDASTLIFVESDASLSKWDFLNNDVMFDQTIYQTQHDALNDFNLIAQPPYLLASLLDNSHPRDRTIFVWDLHTGEEIFSVDVPFQDRFINILEISASGKYLAGGSTGDDMSGDAGRMIEIWNINTAEHKIVSLNSLKLP